MSEVPHIVVLLSAGRHPVSGRHCPVPVELQAIGLGHMLCGTGAADAITGLHAGPGTPALADALGHGLARLVHLETGGEDDPLPSLIAALREEAPALILAGRAGQGGEDTGTLPYALARALSLPIVADAVALKSGPLPGTLQVEQALPRGARRRLVVRLPAVITVHPAAPAPRPFAFAARTRGEVEQRPGVPSPRNAPAQAIEERPYRPRPRLIAKSAAGASAAERLKAATEAASGGGRLLVDPAPEEAAREILAHLRGLGVLRR
ncbi:electron transfer flavoprotein subunit beta [Ancylobacter pratisalsi]|uniref:Electron transfer flavoprotein subunit beta n=1 Tax=Ancylobacter pratisalsi TaxID=1745854 RepID=A0A6P1YKZ0_9HYPH|nr:electron transfer flavoprotein subunit beta [Ancylobacter pratisalsi]QIB33361.1 electron transfer flavoprotein subunit beta [Ancylobacter pratisalsi]